MRIKKALMIIAVAALSSNCSKEPVTTTTVDLFVSFKANGAQKELRIDGSDVVVFTTQHSSHVCPDGDSAQVEYGCNYQLYSGSNVSQDVSIYFYLTDLKTGLSQYNGVYFFADLDSVKSRLSAGTFGYSPILCPARVIAVVYYYESGKLYRSTMHPNESGSFFNLTRIENIQHATFGASLLLEGSFECTVANNAGDTLFLSDGKFTGVMNNPD